MRKFTLLLCFVAITLLAGCAVDPATQAKINAGHQDAAVKVAAIADAHSVASAKAAADPVTHPATATSDAIAALRQPLFAIFTVSLVSIGVFVGLHFTTSFSLLSKIGIPIAIGVALASLLGIVALPFFPWILLVALLAIVGLFIYEWIRLKSFTAALTDVEQDIKQAPEDLGFGGGYPLMPAPTAAKPAASAPAPATH